MTDTFDNQNIFPSVEEDSCAARPLAESVQSITLSYKLANTDEVFLMREDLRAVGLQLERLKSDLVQQENEVDAIVVTFGRTRFPSSEVAQERLQNAEREALGGAVASATLAYTNGCLLESLKALTCLTKRLVLAESGFVHCGKITVGRVKRLSSRVSA